MPILESIEGRVLWEAGKGIVLALPRALNRHGRFRQSGVFRKVFEEIVQRCLEAGLVEGRNLAVDGTLVIANASQQSRVPRIRAVLDRFGARIKGVFIHTSEGSIGEQSLG